MGGVFVWPSNVGVGMGSVCKCRSGMHGCMYMIIRGYIFWCVFRHVGLVTGVGVFSGMCACPGMCAIRRVCSSVHVRSGVCSDLRAQL